ncbi:hypothetical protein [Pseudomonas cichorii]|uniref:hypothetical protein n=1 Tax=Pseudomonas cichorii TaxID=36746 RepID=UPI001C897B82|nr:hypothetical protein [Pseudomonas cichorii]MBX8496334.1 hypothetical protein [Pseudomonas cichorii]MBX8513388.1 hypothetical protein [Pseudomonas cichorii]
MFDSFVMRLCDQSCIAQVASPVPERNGLIYMGFMNKSAVAMLLEDVLCCSGVGGATVVSVYAAISPVWCGVMISSFGASGLCYSLAACILSGGVLCALRPRLDLPSAVPASI